MKIGYVVSEICERTDRQTKQTDRQTDVLISGVCWCLVFVRPSVTIRMQGSSLQKLGRP